MKQKYLLTILAAMISALCIGCAGSPSEDEQAEEAVTVIAKGETITIDNVCEFRIQDIDFTQEPEHYHKAESGKTYVEVSIVYKNLTDEDVWAKNIAEGKLLYSGKYEYVGVARSGEDDKESLTYTYSRTVKPQKTEYIYYFFSVPEEIQGSDGAIELDLSICDNDYCVIEREGTKEPPSDEKDSGETGKTSGAVESGETVVTENCEFYVDFAKITKDIRPTKPGEAYVYFSADTGMTFIDLCVAYKNTSDQHIRADKSVSAKLKLSEDNTCKASHLVETNGRAGLDYAGEAYIIPLCTEYVHCVFQVPEEEAEDLEHVEISFKVDGHSYSYLIP